jgi:hypothetical protein
MRFLVLIQIDPALQAALPQAEADAMMRSCLAHAERLKAQGILLDSQQLEPPAQARTLRERDGKARWSDGPFAETKEFLAGFNLIEAADEGEALRIAASFPWARLGSIEVRPVRDMDAVRRRVAA